MDQPASQPGRTSRLRALANEIRDFAEKEAERSGLPGQDQGPADAYRHLVGVAEMARRAGPLPAFAAAEWNELGSFFAMTEAIVNGRPIASSNTPAARRMDRHNNTLAVGIGATARSTEEVVGRVRVLMERAIASQGGTGFDHTPRWQQSRFWTDGGNLGDWSPIQWPDLATSEHYQRYRNRIGASGRPERMSTGGGPVQVSPHTRDGHPVSGHTRSAPAR